MLWLAISFWCVDRSSFNYKKPGIDSVFVDWNKTTFQSLERQLQRMPDSTQRAAYENRLSVIEGYLSIKNLEEVNNKSIRYEFLSKIFSDLKRKSDFYIIEANNSGAKVLIRNFVVYLNSTRDVHVDMYLHGTKGWFKQAEVKNLDCAITDGFESNYVKHGFNDDDIIVTKFEKNEVKYSEYFLDGTLSKSSGVKEILNTDNTKNFIK